MGWRARCPGSPSRRRVGQPPKAKTGVLRKLVFALLRCFLFGVWQVARSCTSSQPRRTRRRSTGRIVRNREYSARARLLRSSEPGTDRHHVFDTQLGDHRFHQLREEPCDCRSACRSAANDVDRRRPRCRTRPVPERCAVQIAQEWSARPPALTSALPFARCRPHVVDEARMGCGWRSRGPAHTMMRLPIGSVPPSGAAKRMPPSPRSFRHVRLDHLRPHARFSAAKYPAARTGRPKSSWHLDPSRLP